jgi:hypothetical protein
LKRDVSGQLKVPGVKEPPAKNSQPRKRRTYEDLKAKDAEYRQRSSQEKMLEAVLTLSLRSMLTLLVD